MDSVFVLFIVGSVIALLYFTPYAVAVHRNHNNQTAIFFTNLFFGWTLIGWAVALIWASTDNVKKAE